MDEAAFLAPWFKKNHNRGVEIISLHYERQTDTASVRSALQRFRGKFDIRYEQVFGGKADKGWWRLCCRHSIPFFRFRPIFIDKKGNVAKNHTGSTGPASGKYDTAFVKEFNEAVDALLQEQ